MNRITNKSDIDVEKVREDFFMLLTNGPDAIIKKMLTSIPGNSEEKVDAMMKDHEFVEESRRKVVDRIISLKVQIDKLTHDEFLFITNVPGVDIGVI